MNSINSFDVGAMCGFGREHAISQGVELASDTANLADVEHCLEPYEHGGVTNMNTWGLPAERVDGFTRGVLLVACGSTRATADSRDLRAVVGANWARGLVSLLGAFVVLMAVGATPISTLVLGVGGGLVVMAAPWVSTQTRPVVVVTMLMAALPFAIVTWWSIASPLVALLALTIGITTIRRDPVRLDRHLHQP